MSWLKMSDTAANHPTALAPLDRDDADERIVNELFGFVVRCAVLSAQNETDYIVSVGTARAMAGSTDRYRSLSALAESGGWWRRVEVETEDGEKKVAFKIVEDDGLVHMIRKAEREWTNQRKRDTSNRALTAAIRLRDGDGCRYCGVIVNWNDRKSARGGTYDHCRPEMPATSPRDMVVACNGCNGTRGAQPDRDKSLAWLKANLKDPPKRPFYKAETARSLRDAGYDVEASVQQPKLIPMPEREDVRVPSETSTSETSASIQLGSTPVDAARAPGVERSGGTVETPTVEHPTSVASAPVVEARRAGIDFQHSSEIPTVEAPAPAVDAPEGDAPVSTGSVDDPGPDRRSAAAADRRHPESGFVGSGRDGSGLSGTGEDESVQVGSAGRPPDGTGVGGQPRRRKQRRRRGGRGR